MSNVHIEQKQRNHYESSKAKERKGNRNVRNIDSI